MGSFTNQQSNGLSAPPYLFCFFYIIAITYISDRLQVRGPFCALSGLLAGIGFIINASTTTTGPRYFSAFLSVLIFASVAILLAWTANIHATESKRAGGYTVLATLGQFGPLLGKYMQYVHLAVVVFFSLTYKRHERLPGVSRAVISRRIMDLSSFLPARICP